MKPKITRQVEQDIKEKICLYSKIHSGVIIKHNGKLKVVAVVYGIRDIYRKIVSKEATKIEIINEIMSLRDMCNEILKEIDK